MPLYGLIGYPLGHSFSQKFFNEKFKKMGLKNFEYKNFPITSIDGLLGLLQQHSDLAGVNVTIPYKIKALEYLDEVDESVVSAGAVNVITIVSSPNKKLLKGFNTDAYAFERTFKPLLNNGHEKALVLGTGGASRAVCSVLRKLGIEYRLVSQNKEPGMFVYEKLNEEIIKDHQIIINTTPLGMFPEIKEFPKIPYEFISKDHLVYDLIYNPEETAFLRMARQQKAKTKNGADMLNLQAEKAMDIFMERWKGK